MAVWQLADLAPFPTNHERRLPKRICNPLDALFAPNSAANGSHESAFFEYNSARAHSQVSVEKNSQTISLTNHSVVDSAYPFLALSG